MNILFLTILRIHDISDRGIYSDLMRKFHKEGHSVFIVTPIERRYRQKTVLENYKNLSILKIKTLNIQKTNHLEKWIAGIFINYQFKRGINIYFSKIKFELVIYSTPPITFTNLVKYIKLKSGSISYLLLKDIFPQNAVDLGLIRDKGLLHSYFVKKERKLYEVSDYIGCMSQANVDYLKKSHPGIDPGKIEINPNSHELFEEHLSFEQKNTIRQRYLINPGDIAFVYGGNLGMPQGVDFILDFLDSQKNKQGAFFLIIGTGTEFSRLKKWFDKNKPNNELLVSELPKHEYNLVLRSCDVGMIFLDKRFTIPNFPSRLLSYLEYRLPVLSATDKATDLSKVIKENNIGLWSEAGDITAIDENVNRLLFDQNLRTDMGQNGYNYFLKNYTIENSYNTILKHFKSSC